MPPTTPDPLETVRATAALARLSFDEDEARALAGDLQRILDAFRGLAEVDTEGVEPLWSPSGRRDVLREDLPVEGLPRERLLAAAPEREGDHFRVPKTVDPGGAEDGG